MCTSLQLKLIAVMVSVSFSSFKLHTECKGTNHQDSNYIRRKELNNGSICEFAQIRISQGSLLLIKKTVKKSKKWGLNM